MEGLKKLTWHTFLLSKLPDDMLQSKWKEDLKNTIQKTGDPAQEAGIGTSQNKDFAVGPRSHRSDGNKKFRAPGGKQPRETGGFDR